MLFQLVPFLQFFGTWLIQGRSQSQTATLPVASALTMVAPWSLGTVDSKDPVQFVLQTNMVEAVAYLGAAAVVLVFVAVALPRRGRGLLPTGAWVFFMAATAAWIELIYVGGAPLALFQKLPGLRALFDQNFIGRARSILGFLLAVLVAVGFEALVRVRAREPKTASASGSAAMARATPSATAAGAWAWLRPWRWPRRWLWTAAVVVGGVAGAAAMVAHGWTTVHLAAADLGPGRGQGAGPVRSQIAGARRSSSRSPSPAWSRWLWRAVRCSPAGGRPTVLRFGAASTLIVLMAVQGAQFMEGYYPKADRSMFYPVTDTHTFLADNLGEQRYASAYDAISSVPRPRTTCASVNGHNFLNANFAALLQGMPDGAVPYPTYVDFQAGDLKQATSPVLDRLGTKYWVAGPTDAVFGTVATAPRSGTTQLIPGQPVTVPMPATGALRGVGLHAGGHRAAAASRG